MLIIIKDDVKASLAEGLHTNSNVVFYSPTYPPNEHAFNTVAVATVKTIVKDSIPTLTALSMPVLKISSSTWCAITPPRVSECGAEFHRQLVHQSHRELRSRPHRNF